VDCRVLFRGGYRFCTHTRTHAHTHAHTHTHTHAHTHTRTHGRQPPATSHQPPATLLQLLGKDFVIGNLPAVRAALRTGVDAADVLEQGLPDLLVHLVGVLVVDHHPRKVVQLGGVRIRLPDRPAGQLLSLAGGAALLDALDGGFRQSRDLGALQVDLHGVGAPGVIDAVDVSELEVLVVIVLVAAGFGAGRQVVERAGFKDVVVLAGRLGLPGAAVGNKGHVGHVGKARRVKGVAEGIADHLPTSGALGHVIQLDLDGLVLGFWFWFWFWFGSKLLLLLLVLLVAVAAAVVAAVVAAVAVAIAIAAAELRIGF